MSEEGAVKLIFKQTSGVDDTLEVDRRLIDFSENLKTALGSSSDGSIRIPGDWIRKSDLEIISNFYKLFNFFSDEENQDLAKNNPYFSSESKVKSEDLLKNIGEKCSQFLKVFQLDGRDFNLSPESLNELALNNCLRICYHLRGFKHFNIVVLKAIATFFYRESTFEAKSKWDEKHENRNDDLCQDEKLKLMGDKYPSYFAFLNQSFVAGYLDKNKDFDIAIVEKLRNIADEQSKKNEEIRAKYRMKYLD